MVDRDTGEDVWVLYSGNGSGEGVTSRKMEWRVQAKYGNFSCFRDVTKYQANLLQNINIRCAQQEVKVVAWDGVGSARTFIDLTHLTTAPGNSQIERCQPVIRVEVD